MTEVHDRTSLEKFPNTLEYITRSLINYYPLESEWNPMPGSGFGTEWLLVQRPLVKPRRMSKSFMTDGYLRGRSWTVLCYTMIVA